MSRKRMSGWARRCARHWRRHYMLRPSVRAQQRAAPAPREEAHERTAETGLQAAFRRIAAERRDRIRHHSSDAAADERGASASVQPPSRSNQ